jgi:hypothetical protein
MNVQKGSVHAVIIIVAICVLIGIVGFVFWQNFIKQEQPNKVADISKPSEPLETPQSTPLIEATFNPAFGSTTSFQYPSTWKLERTLTGPTPIEDSGQSSTYEHIKVISPSKKYSITYSMYSHGGVGGACDQDDKTFEVAQIDYSEPKKFPGVSFVQLVIKRNTTPTSTYSYDIGLKKTQDISGRMIGDWTCPVAVGLSGVFSVENDRMLIVQAKIAPLEDDSNGTPRDMPTIDAITDNFSGDEYEQMKSIMVSTKGTLIQL